MGDIYIAVMGPTGAGKSQFISHCSGSNAPVNDGLHSCTVLMEPYDFTRNGRKIYLIDTPGFDDTKRTDYALLKEVATWLGSAFQKNVLLNAVLYLHGLTEARVTGSGSRNLRMFKKLCGEDYYRRLYLITTKWDKITTAEGIRKETDLKTEQTFWADMVNEGAQTKRHFGTKDSALAILDEIISRSGRTSSKASLKLQTELARGCALGQTSVGQTLKAELVEQQEELARESKETADEIREAVADGDEEGAASQRQYAMVLYGRKMQNVQEQNALAMTLHDMQKAEDDENARLAADLDREEAAAKERGAVIPPELVTKKRSLLTRAAHRLGQATNRAKKYVAENPQVVRNIVEGAVVGAAALGEAFVEYKKDKRECEKYIAGLHASSVYQQRIRMNSQQTGPTIEYLD